MSVRKALALEQQVHHLNVRRQGAILAATDGTDDPAAWLQLDSIDLQISRKMRRAKIYRLGAQLRQEAREGVMAT